MQALRRQYPDHFFVCYINSTADVKAACDLCVTSTNVVRLCASLPSDKIFFLPDNLMAKNLQNELRALGIQKEILSSQGRCMVHEQFSTNEVEYIRSKFSDLYVAAHPECLPEVTQMADFVGSTSQIAEKVLTVPQKNILALTECGLTHKLQADERYNEKTFVGSCTLCPYMRSNTLSAIEHTLTHLPKEQEIIFDQKTASAARRCIDRMLEWDEKLK